MIYIITGGVDNLAQIAETSINYLEYFFRFIIAISGAGFGAYFAYLYNLKCQEKQEIKKIQKEYNDELKCQTIKLNYIIQILISNFNEIKGFSEHLSTNILKMNKDIENKKTENYKVYGGVSISLRIEEIKVAELKFLSNQSSIVQNILYLCSLLEKLNFAVDYYNQNLEKFFKYKKNKFKELCLENNKLLLGKCYMSADLIGVILKSIYLYNDDVLNLPLIEYTFSEEDLNFLAISKKENRGI